ncbi:inactive peptidyl-prolyl cis-trans isomerase shutdown-like [Melitaea cinxia]|uniref:inactive peptidyl-prolyl cis-trans isomerase shutdown-like n=1 Tax=Melitaea cinxia TaxID=113334 RepID=UPI001E274A98|nr:inactive peptidyl-prolyl cis-trans isomerase shutdown-like [Melitaea cinxia]
MEDVFKDPVPLSEGIKLKDLLSGNAEFHLDMDFKKSSMGMMLNCDDDLFPDMDDGNSDSEDTYKNLEAETEKNMLSSPEYHSFSDLSSKMVDCIPSGEVKMLIIEEGDGPLVPVDAMCTLHYAAYFEKASLPFDSTLTMNNGAPMSLRLGRGRFLPGLEIGLTSVKGPKARFLLLLQPSMAWGPLGVPPRIRPEPALFVIVLYDVDDIQGYVRYNDLPSEEQKKYEVIIKTVKSLHNHAKVLFSKKQNYSKAIKNYQQAISILNTAKTENSDESNEVKRLKINSYTNLAVCYYKLNKPKHIINMCEALEYVTDIEKHCKVMFYYARGHEMLGKYEEALKYYKKALKLEPKNTDIGAALANLDKYFKKSADQERDLWQNAFQCTSQKKAIVYDVDEDFKNGVVDMCQNLVARDEYAKFDLAPGLTKDEISCIKDLSSKFEGIVVLEEGEGRKKRFSVVKKSKM